MIALYERDTGAGAGRVIDTSLLEPLLGILGPGRAPLTPARPRTRTSRQPVAEQCAPKRVLTRDGHWVAISASATSVADLAAEPWFSSASEHVQHGDELDGAVAEWIRGRDFDAVTEAFQDVGAALAPIYNMRQLVNDPHVREREAITTVDDEDLGPLRMQNVMFRIVGAPGQVRFAGRRLGQDNAEVYRELLGFDDAALTDLRARQVI